jgi:hypothetical protein
MRRYIILGALTLVLLAGCAGQQLTATRNPGNESTTAASSASDAASSRSARTFGARVSDAGQVVVEVTPLNLGQSEDTDVSSTGLHFQVAMNTHSVELDHDLTRLTVLRTDQGDEILPLRWDGGQGGHHVNGTLYFPAVELNGVRWVEIVIRDVDGVPERVFRWDLEPR